LAPAIGDRRLSIHRKFPENCAPIAEPTKFEAAGSYNERGTLRCNGGIVGGTIAIDGLAATMTDVIVRLSPTDNSVHTVRLTPSAPSFVVEAVPGQWEVAATYLKLGVKHILFGIDHLLFVLALITLVKGWRRLVGTITAFTVAHSITLAAASLGFVQVPGSPVEAMEPRPAANMSCSMVAALLGLCCRLSLLKGYPHASVQFGLCQVKYPAYRSCRLFTRDNRPYSDAELLVELNVTKSSAPNFEKQKWTEDCRKVYARVLAMCCGIRVAPYPH
jgi:hypothetical protein